MGKEIRMKILLITPGINKDFNDNVFSYSYIYNKGNQICAITNQKSTTKGYSVSKINENIDGIEVHRIFRDFNEQIFYPTKKLGVVKKIVNDFKPEIIFCSQQKNLYLGKKIKLYLGIPLVLLVEFGYDERYPFRLIGKERFIKNRRLGGIIAKVYWKWLCKNSDAIITCNPNDTHNIRELKKFNKNLFYIPWPSFPTYKIPEDLKKENRGIFIGALEPHKNISEFKETLPKILCQSKIKQFIVVGKGKDICIIKELKRKYPNRFIHIPKVPRSEALKMIAQSYFAYVPAKYGAWGFIEDCWAMKTPIIATTNHYNFKNGKDSIVCKKENIVCAVQFLKKDLKTYTAIQDCGYKRFNHFHHAFKIGEKYIEIFKYILKTR
jgi:glycosyltransferase involved in cell wall biosynthesis